jgi:hypothetical protein
MVNRAISGTVESTVVRKKKELKGKILEILKSSDNPVSTSDLCSNLGKAWHTIDRTCLMLQVESKIDGFRVGKMNLWRAK